jgi:hypothetical protein
MARKSSRAVAKGKKSDDDDNDDEKKKNHSPAKRKTKAAAAAGRATKKSSKVAAATEDETSEDEQLTWSDEETENRLPFCCAVCHCSEDFKRLVPAHAPWISPGEKMLLYVSLGFQLGESIAIHPSTELTFIHLFIHSCAFLILFTVIAVVVTESSESWTRIGLRHF